MSFSSRKRITISEGHARPFIGRNSTSRRSNDALHMLFTHIPEQSITARSYRPFASQVRGCRDTPQRPADSFQHAFGLRPPQ